MGHFLKKIIIISAMAFVILAGITACSKKTNEDQHGSHDPGDMNFMHIHGLGYSSDGKRLFIPVHNGLKVYADAALLKVNQETKQFVTIKTPLQGDNGIMYLSGNPVKTDELVLATENKDVYVSTDHGVTWRQIADKGQAQNN